MPQTATLRDMINQYFSKWIRDEAVAREKKTEHDRGYTQEWQDIL